MNKRLFLLNGVAILGVALNHAAGWGQIAMFQWAHRYQPVTMTNYDQLGSLAYYVLLVTRQLTLFGVAAFLFVSGFFIAFAARGSQATLSWKMVWVRIRNLLVPYLIWSVAIFAFDYVLRISYSPLQYLAKFFTTGAIGPYYFVPLLCYLYLLSPFLVPIARTRARLLLYIAALVQLSTMSLRYFRVFQIPIPMLDQLITYAPDWSLPRWIFFFVLGLVSGFHLEPLKQWLERAKWELLAALVPLALLSIVEPEVIFRVTGIDMRWVPLLISTGLYSVAFILCFLAFDTVSLPMARIFYYLGSRTYGIYLLHMKIMEIVGRASYHFFPWLLAHQIAYQPVLLLCGLGGPLLLMTVIAKSPARNCYRYLFG